MRRIFGISLLVTLTLVASPAVTTWAAKKPVKKPPQRVVLGTTQLKGDQAKFGVTYTLGKTAPLNVTLNSAEYTTDRVCIGNGFVAPKADEKILVLHYTVHNPNKGDYGLAWSTLNITAVDADSQNWRYYGEIGMEDTKARCNMSLKPAQKTKLYAAIVVPAKGEIPKVIFEGRDRLVLRYDLRGKVKPIPAPIADAADATGATPLAEVAAQLGTYYQMRQYDVKLDSVAFTDQPIKGKSPKKSGRFLTLIASIKNGSPGKQGISWNVLQLKLVDQDGLEVHWNGELLSPSRDEKAYTSLEPGQEVRVRYFYEVPSGVGLKSFTLKPAHDARAYVYDLSQVQ